jgi:hypothetical protein
MTDSLEARVRELLELEVLSHQHPYSAFQFAARNIAKELAESWLRQRELLRDVQMFNGVPVGFATQRAIADCLEGQ